MHGDAGCRAGTEKIGWSTKGDAGVGSCRAGEAEKSHCRNMKVVQCGWRNGEEKMMENGVGRDN